MSRNLSKDVVLRSPSSSKDIVSKSHSRSLEKVPEGDEEVLTDELIAQYHKLDLTENQKKDLHVLLLQLRSVNDLQSFSDVTYEDVKKLLCCDARECKCGSKYAETHGKLGVPISESVYESQRLKELEENLEFMTMRHEKIQRFLRERQIEHPDYTLDSGRSVNSLRKHIQYLKGLCYQLHQSLKGIL